jgi:hypothetical protein
MNIITRKHDFNRPIRFTEDGFFAFLYSQNLKCLGSRNGEFHIYEDLVENIYAFKLNPEEFSGTQVYAVLLPLESKVIAKISQFD